MASANSGATDVRRWSWALIGILLFLQLWTVASLRIGNPVLLPKPQSVLFGFIDLVREGSLLADIKASLRRVMGGFAIAPAHAVPFALVRAFSRPVILLLSPIVSFLRPIPPIAWIPIAILWFGIGDPPSYFITAVAAFFPIFINSFACGNAVRPEHTPPAPPLGPHPPPRFTPPSLPPPMP